MTNISTSGAIMPVPTVIGRLLTFAMAAASGVAVANIYYNQPMLGLIQADFAGQPAAALIPTATQIGYALGLALVVPLGDMLPRRRLIVGQFLALGLALVAAAVAPTALALLVASVLVGAGATVAQQIVPFAASLATAETRGRVIGTVMAGLLAGILFSRTLAGWVAVHDGWRQMFWLGLPMAVVAALVMGAWLPAGRPDHRIGYRAALASLVGLWRAHAGLRLATLVQAGLFASFSVFWTILALHLQEPAFALGADAAGLFGAIGVVGVVAAPLAGRLADRRGPRVVVMVGAVATLAAWAVFGLADTLVGLVVGVTLLDFGVQAALVSNQHTIYALDPAARSRLNTVFMTGMFLGAAAGSAVAMAAWQGRGWLAVTLLGAGLAAAALVAQLVGTRRRNTL